MRVEGHGAGIVLPPDASEAKIARALERLVAEPGYSIAARRMGEAMALEIEAQMVVREVEALAGSGVTE
jgi:UDP:flavonoid glycosyltransferase YjiC (YdhE family)